MSQFGDKKIVKKILNPPTGPTMFWHNPCFFACRRCLSCRQVHTRLRGLTEFQSAANQKTFQIKAFSFMRDHSGGICPYVPMQSDVNRTYQKYFRKKGVRTH